ncbi:hypothetical protein [Neoroseomonas lacus]|uniref:Uncharacterized protein n=1 Tax=Neoroseomonas lacus TaxID=287609 RepID=A0A917NSU9_9PROT|nr:hypothetical protein [Neoroseomonas lacus]GGJ21785.1 hypothetical protein GCM10011320_31280 [Neoroseomonas lacus]
MTGRKKKEAGPPTLKEALAGPDGEAIRIMALHRFIELGGGRWGPKAYQHGAPPGDGDAFMTTEQVLEHGGTVPVPHNLTIKRSEESGVTFAERGRRRTDGSATLAWSHQILILAACGACMMSNLAPPTPADFETLVRTLHAMQHEADIRTALRHYQDGHEHRRLHAAEEAFAEPVPRVAESDVDGMFSAARDVRAERALAANVKRCSEEDRDARDAALRALADGELVPEMLAAPVALAEDGAAIDVDEVDAAFAALGRLLLTADRKKLAKVQLGGQLRDALRRRVNAMLAGAPPHPMRGIGEWEVAFLRGAR